MGILESLPWLDRLDSTGDAELIESDPIFEFAVPEVTGVSIVGLARDQCVDAALQWGADYILFYDDDMRFDNSMFLRLFREQKPVISPLAFTSREPCAPVIYSFKKTWNFALRREDVQSQVVFDYPRNTVFECGAVGTGIVLIDMTVFKRIPKPWFYGSVGSGEDVHFFFRCWQSNIPVHVHTGIRTQHVRNDVFWMDEEHYDQMKAESKRFYADKCSAPDNRNTDLRQLSDVALVPAEPDDLHRISLPDNRCQ